MKQCFSDWNSDVYNDLIIIVNQVRKKHVLFSSEKEKKTDINRCILYVLCQSGFSSPCHVVCHSSLSWILIYSDKFRDKVTWRSYADRIKYLWSTSTGLWIDFRCEIYTKIQIPNIFFSKLCLKIVYITSIFSWSKTIAALIIQALHLGWGSPFVFTLWSKL